MLPTYQDGGVKPANRLAYARSAPERGDVVAIRLPGQSVMYLKRIIGLPGDTVAFHKGHLLINGEVVAEPYLNPSCAGLRPRRSRRLVLCCRGRRSMPENLHEKGKTPRQRDRRKGSLVKKPVRLILAAALIGLAIWGWRVWFPSPQMPSARALNLARTVSFEPGEGTIPRGLKAQSLGDYFTSDVVITWKSVALTRASWKSRRTDAGGDGSHAAPPRAQGRVPGHQRHSRCRKPDCCCQPDGQSYR